MVKIDPKKKVIKGFRNSDIEKYPLPVPCLLWVPMWLLGIVMGKYITIPFFIIFFCIITTFILIFLKKTKIYSLVVIAFIAGYLFYKNSINFPENHLTILFEKESTSIIEDSSINETSVPYVYLKHPETDTLNYTKNLEPTWSSVQYKNYEHRLAYIQQYLQGRIVSDFKPTKAGFRYTLDLISIANNPVKGKILIILPRDDFVYGDIIEGVFRITEPRVTNPGAFAYNKVMEQSRIYGIGYNISPLLKIDNTSSYLNKYLFFLKDKMRNRIDKYFDYSKPMVQSLLLGERHFLAEYEENFLLETLPKSGLMYFFAVSGLHVGIITLFLLLFFGIFRIPILLTRFLTIIVLIFYAFICNLSPPIVRAVIFVIIYLFAKSSCRLISDWQVFFFTLFVVSLINPETLFSISLQFSYMAMAGIFFAKTLYKITSERLLKYRLSFLVKKMLFFFIFYIYINICIQILLIPLQIYHFNMVNLNVLVGNPIGLLLISVLIPLYLIILIIPFKFFIYFAEMLTLIFNESILIFSKLPFISYHSKSLTIIIFMIIFSLLGLYLISQKYKAYMYIFKTYTRTYSISKSTVGYISSLLCFIVSFTFLFNLSKAKKFQIIFFDTGRADMCLIRFSQKDYMIIDTSEYENNNRNITQNLLPYLKKERVKSISKVILSHPHNDHFGGIFKLIENIQIDTLIIHKSFMETTIGKDIYNNKNFRDTYFYVIDDTLTYKNNSYSINFIHPDNNYFHKNPNNNSIVCRVNYRNLAVLFTGDIEAEAERYIVQKYPNLLSANIMKAPHHGSRTSSTIDFLNTVNPEVFVISSSGNIKQGFPNQIILDRVKSLVKKTYTTGLDGAIIINYN